MGASCWCNLPEFMRRGGQPVKFISVEGEWWGLEMGRIVLQWMYVCMMYFEICVCVVIN
jgi:hypothetical protein